MVLWVKCDRHRILCLKTGPSRRAAVQSSASSYAELAGYCQLASPNHKMVRPPFNTKGYSSTYLAMEFANVQTGTIVLPGFNWGSGGERTVYRASRVLGANQDPAAGRTEQKELSGK